MFFYKLRKVLRDSWLEILKSSSMLSFIASFIPFFAFLFIWHDDFSINEKKQMLVVSIFCLLINLSIIYSVDYFFGYNIIVSLFIGAIFSFFLYLIPGLVIMVWFEFSELRLDKSEIREAKINSLIGKLF